MKKKLRSRGIRLKKNENMSYVESKIYYEPENILFKNQKICEWELRKILRLFEYSEINNCVDTFNFHVDLLQDYSCLYDELDDTEKDVIYKIPQIFDERFKNYTVGYRLQDDAIVGQSYYFYPTFLKDYRYGIKGITDTTTIANHVKKFAMSVSDGTACGNEIVEFGLLLNKLKGVSFHINSKMHSYKLYGRMDFEVLRTYLLKNMGYDLNDLVVYGEVALVAQRIENGCVTGYNVYYLL